MLVHARQVPTDLRQQFTQISNCGHCESITTISPSYHDAQACRRHVGPVRHATTFPQENQKAGEHGNRGLLPTTCCSLQPNPVQTCTPRTLAAYLSYRMYNWLTSGCSDSNFSASESPTAVHSRTHLSSVLTVPKIRVGCSKVSRQWKFILLQPYQRSYQTATASDHDRT